MRIQNLENKKQKKLEKEELGIDALKLKIKNKSHKNISLNYKKNLPASSNKISKSSKSNKNILLTQNKKKEKEKRILLNLSNPIICELLSFEIPIDLVLDNAKSHSSNLSLAVFEILNINPNIFT